jgi:hypothetical protein
MPDYPPFMNAYGLIPKILQKIKDAKTPSRFTQDFLGTNLGFPSGSAKVFIPFAKRLNLLSSDGAPTDIYNEFRNPDRSKSAIAKAMKIGYAILYDRNEYAHKLDRKGLEGLIIQATGLDQGAPTLRAIVGSFEALKPLADFEPVALPTDGTKAKGKDKHKEEAEEEDGRRGPAGAGFKMNLAYTINLNLPKSDDIAVFNAIFKALRDNLLRQ